MTLYQTKGKRIFDICLSLIAVVALSPLFITGFILVFIGDGRPFFFTQTRIGQNLKSFELYKFRSMKKNTEHLGSVSHENDPRYFWGSKLIRKSKIDELPQIFNILKGDMSIVGPRPTVQEDYDKMTKQQKQRAAIKPGLTGLAQISGGQSMLWPERIKLDLAYHKQLSFLTDCKIIIRTAFLWTGNKLDTPPPKNGEW